MVLGLRFRIIQKRKNRNRSIDRRSEDSERYPQTQRRRTTCLRTASVCSCFASLSATDCNRHNADMCLSHLDYCSFDFLLPYSHFSPIIIRVWEDYWIWFSTSTCKRLCFLVHRQWNKFLQDDTRPIKAWRNTWMCQWRVNNWIANWCIAGRVCGLMDQLNMLCAAVYRPSDQLST